MRGLFKNKWKSVTGLALSTMMIVSSTSPVLAAEPNQYVYDNAGFRFEKVSHMDSPQETPDGIIDYVENIGGGVAEYEPGKSPKDHGDRGQSYSYAAATYGDWVYINTMYFGLNLKYILSSDVMEGVDFETAKAVVDALYNGHINFGNEDGGMSGGVLVKVNVKTGETKVLMSRNKNGLIPTFRNATVMNGKIYFEGMLLDTSKLTPKEINMGIAMQNGMPCIYEIDPKTDEFRPVYECVDVEGYRELLKAQIFPSTRAIGKFDDHVVAGGIDANGSYLLITDNPSGGQDAFVKIADMDDLFNYPASGRADATGGGGIYQVIEYNGKLYVGICSGNVETTNEFGTMRPFAIVRGECKGDPMKPENWTWSPLVGDKEKDGAKYTFGIDPERIASVGVTLETYGGYLYIGEYNDSATALRSAMNSKTFDAMSTNLEQSINLYRMDEDENIEMVVGDPTKMFPEGGISGKPSGYDTHMSQYTWQTEVYEGKMYISTMDMSTMMRPFAMLVNGELVNLRGDDLIRQLNYIRVLLELLLNDDKEVEEGVAALEASIFSEADQNTRADKMAKLVEIAEKAAERSANEGATTYSLRDKIKLTADQKSQMVNDLVSGKIVPGSVDAAKRADLDEINNLIEQLKDLLDSDDHEAFAKIYDLILEKLDAIMEKLPEPLKKIYEMITNPETQKVLHNVISSLKNMKDSVAGFDLYELEQDKDGNVSIRTITNDGFGDRYNHGLRIFAQTEDYLMVGTANPFYGTQLWRRKNTVPGKSDIDPDDFENVPDETETETKPETPETNPDKPETEPVKPETNPDRPETKPETKPEKPVAKPESVKTDKQEVPKTGDSNAVVVLSGSLLASIALAGVMIELKKRRRV